MKYNIILILIITLFNIINGVHLKGNNKNILESNNDLSINFCTTFGGCPVGNYQKSCTNCFVNTLAGSLTCNCYPNQVVSTLPNAWACSTAIQNVNGVLTCVYPPGTTSVFTYTNIQVCQGCLLNGATLQCTCQGNAVSLAFATNCVTGIEYVPNGASLVCVAPTPSPTYPTPQPTYPTPQPTFPTPQPTFPTPQPTFPTPQPTFPTPQPTFPTPQPTFPTPQPTFPTASPQNAGNVCQGQWLNVLATGEAAPTRTCTAIPNMSQFTSAQGCQMQNYCCWNSNLNTCQLPANIPVECAALNQQQCGSFPQFCQWASLSTGGASCQRLCPGNPSVQCPNFQG